MRFKLAGAMENADHGETAEIWHDTLKQRLLLTVDAEDGEMWLTPMEARLLASLLRSAAKEVDGQDAAVTLDKPGRTE